jgi:hypothetical protein
MSAIIVPNGSMNHLAHGCEPGQRLDEIAVKENLGVGIDGP